LFAPPMDVVPYNDAPASASGARDSLPSVLLVENVWSTARVWAGRFPVVIVRMPADKKIELQHFINPIGCHPLPMLTGRDRHRACFLTAMGRGT
jgi:hypothetical protein